MTKMHIAAFAAAVLVAGCTYIYKYPAPAPTATSEQSEAPTATATPASSGEPPTAEQTPVPSKPRELTKEEIDRVAARAYAALGQASGGASIESFSIRSTRTPGRVCRDGSQPLHVKAASDNEYFYDRWHCPRDLRR